MRLENSKQSYYIIYNNKSNLIHGNCDIYVTCVDGPDFWTES